VLQSLVASSCSTHTTQAQGGQTSARDLDRMVIKEQHIASHCNALQYTETHCNKLDRIATRCKPRAGDLVRMVIKKKHCNTLQHIAIHGNTLQHAATPVPGIWSGSSSKNNTRRQHTATYCNTQKYTAIHCNTLQHAATPVLGIWSGSSSKRNTLQHTAIFRNTHTATHCNPLQHTAIHCNTLQYQCQESGQDRHQRAAESVLDVHLSVPVPARRT